ncbi:MAG TPA: hypothetical protein VEJ18_05095, partial [Planctomycetota bacterium]|nr:hypothetical protein [Planctomycetota bacterium]
VTAPHLGRAFEERELVLLLVLQAALAAAWFAEGARRESTAAFVLAETAVLGMALAARTQLAFATTVWRPEYDVWATLGAFVLLGGAQSALDRPGLRRPLAGTLLLLPAAGLALTLARGLGTDVLLIVLGLQATMFSFLGRDRRDSPYHAAATAGAVAFVMVLFWSKLEIRLLHAYVIPVGMGVLVLLQLFGRGMDPGARNAVRTTALLAMLGSAGYYALADDRHPLAFNLTLVAVGLAAMGLGSLLRIRVYVLLGFSAVMVDLASILVKGLGTLDRSARMTALGVGVLVVGGLLVFGAAWAKLHRDEVESALARLRARLGGWE